MPDVARDTLVPEVREAYREALLLTPTAAEMEAALAKKITRVFPAKFWVREADIVVAGKGFEYLRKKVADHLAKGKDIRFLIPQAVNPPKRERIALDGRDKYAFRYARSTLKDVWAFKTALDQVIARHPKTRVIDTPVATGEGHGAAGVGVVGKDFPFDEPAWLTRMLPGPVGDNPAIDKNGVWYFGEVAVDIALVAQSMRQMRKFLKGDNWKRFPYAYMMLDANFDDPANELYKKQTIKLLKTAAYTHFMVGWDNHARLLVRTAPDELTVVDPWMDAARIRSWPGFAAVEAFVQSVHIGRGKNKTPLRLVIADKRRDQEREGSCVLAAMARALWISNEGVDKALQHPIPPLYAVMAKRLAVPKLVNQKEREIEIKRNSDPRRARRMARNIADGEAVLHPHIRKPLSLPDPADGSLGPLPRCMKYDTTDLKPHQERVVRFMMSSQERGMVLFHTVGSGKTITAIATARCLMRPNTKIVVATPASVKKQFEREFDKLAIPDVKARATVVTHQGLATHYDKLVDGRTILIIDEAHNFKNMAGVRTTAAIAAAHRAYKVLLLSATPITNGMADLLPLLAMLEGTESKLMIDRIKATLKVPPQDLDLSAYKCKFSYFITPMDVRNYPSFTERYVTLEMDAEYYKRYLRLQEESIPFDDEDAVLHGFQGKQLKVFMNGIRRAANLMGDTMSAKVQYAIDRAVEDVGKGRKVLIYSGFKANGVHFIKKALTERGVPVLFIDGSQSLPQRMRDVQKYNSGQVPVLLITLAGAEGLDLKGTRTVMLMDPWWNVSKIEQIVGRAVRFQSHAALPKEERHVDVLYLVLKKPAQRAETDKMPLSADELIYRMGESKMEAVGSIYSEIHANSIEKCPRRKGHRASA